MNHRLLLSRTGEDEADILWDNPGKSLALGGITYEFAERLVACVNACAGIPNESLISVNWQLAPKAGAKPLDVANLILKLAAYRDALAKIADMIGAGPGLPIFDDIKAVVKETLE